MSDSHYVEMKLADLQAQVEQLPAAEISAPQPLSLDELKDLDAAFTATPEQQSAAALAALWTVGPLLGDLVGTHLKQEKKQRDEEEEEPESGKPI